MSGGIRTAWVLFFSAATLLGCARPEGPLVGIETPIAYLANRINPELGNDWILPGFDDSSWDRGTFGVGYDKHETSDRWLPTRVSPGTASVYTRTRFTVDDPTAVEHLLFSVDYDDGFTAWINGVEVAHSKSMRGSGPKWDSRPGSHGWSDGVDSGREYFDISEAGIPVLRSGENLLAVGVWNRGSDSDDLVLFVGLESNPEPVVIRGPYLQRATPDGITIRWRTSIAASGGLLYGLRPDRLTQRAGREEEATDHAARITGLEPGTRYYYAIEGPNGTIAGGDDRHSFSTAPAPGDTKPIRAWILGDPGEGGAAARSVRDAYAELAGDRPADLILTLGDNAYPDGTDEDYQRHFFIVYRDLLRRSTLWPVFGNHDGHSADSETQSGPYYDLFTLPKNGESGGLASGTEAYYAFDHGNVHFVVLDTDETDLSRGSPMLSWLERDLRATTQDWIIACFHHPPYSAGVHYSDAPDHPMEYVRQNVVPILDRYDVAMTFSGHSHSYERSRLLAGHYGPSGTLSQKMFVDSGDGRADGSGAYCVPTSRPAGRPFGVVHTVLGSSSRVDPEGTLDFPVMAASLAELGSVVLDVDGDRMTTRFLGADGSILDTFSIERRDDCAR